jgi:hypothetical protein
MDSARQGPLRLWLAMATACIGAMGGVAVLLLPASEPVGHASPSVNGPQVWHVSLNALAAKFTDSRLSSDCFSFSSQLCADSFREVAVTLGPIERDIREFDATGFPRTVAEIAGVVYVQREFDRRCNGQPPKTGEQTATPAQRDGLSDGERMIQNARSFDTSEPLRLIDCSAWVGTLLGSIQSVANALKADTR